jgi:phospholipase C
MLKRRDILQGTLGLSVFPALDKALALPARNQSASITDVEHVVILMQENRSFDHYFGCLKGVRGFGDPRAMTLPSGKPVWLQPTAPGAETHVAPFRFDARTTSAESIASLDHSWKGSHDRWKNNDAWIPAKTPLTMGHFAREDIPFYYALADAFTVCDAYHASQFGPTNPNRMYLFTGTSGVNVGLTGSMAVSNPLAEPNETADYIHDGPKFPGFEWKTYAERLEDAGISWKVYQEYDNYGDNGLAYFKAFRGAGAATPMGQKARAWAEGSNAANASASRGEHLVEAFAADVAGGTLPQVSWIVAPTALCEHPQGSPSYGEQLTARLIAALTANPAVWAKTVFILNYDENDGFFDHMPIPIPAAGTAQGQSNVDTAGEVYRGEPMGLGPRVPMLIVSPWSKGGFVNSELFDHTSVIRFIEARFGVHEPNITPWRRAVCGDLTSAFDFKTPNAAPVRLPDVSHYVEKVDLTVHLPKPVPPLAQTLPKQEPGQRPARPLPYDVHVAGMMNADGFHLVFANAGQAAATFQVYAAGGPAAGAGSAGPAGPWFYTVAAGTTLTDILPLAQGPHDVTVHGPNGFYRRYKASGFDRMAPTTTLARDRAADQLVLTLANPSQKPRRVTLANACAGGKPKSVALKPGATSRVTWPLAPSAHWYDVAITSDSDPAYLHRFAGHFETGEASLSDPLIAGGEGGLAARLLQHLKV